jgi:C-terminal processing protease CtpA/Prc
VPETEGIGLASPREDALKRAIAGLVLALSACSPAPDAAATAAESGTRPKPTAEFLALDRRAQNLAVYDAFWQQVESNYYEPDIFATDEWRARRAEWREKAAAAESRVILYQSMFPRLLELMPESHVSVQAPEGRSNRDQNFKRPPVDEQTATHLATLMFIHGPGFSSATTLRGGARISLVGEVWADSPAAEAGIPPGARLLRSNGNLDPAAKAVHFEVDFVPLDATAARAWERGDGADQPPAPESIVRARYDLRPFPYRQPVETRRLEGGVQYLRFNGFGDEESMKPVYKAVDAAQAAGLIVDLRWNGGGFSHQLQRFAGALLGPDSHLADTRTKGGAARMLATAYETPYAGPLVVLTGPCSASAAEIFAAAVQDLKRGKVIGRATSGAVLAAQGFPLPDGGVVGLPITNVWRIGGERIEGVGVEPDIWMLPTLDEVRAGRDPLLQRALLELQLQRSAAVDSVSRKSSVPGQ